MARLDPYHMAMVDLIEAWPKDSGYPAKPEDLARCLNIKPIEVEHRLYDLYLVYLVTWNDEEELSLVKELKIVGEVS